jgi:hypothetical protein
VITVTLYSKHLIRVNVTAGMLMYLVLLLVVYVHVIYLNQWNLLLVDKVRKSRWAEFKCIGDQQLLLNGLVNLQPICYNKDMHQNVADVIGAMLF